MRSVPRRSRLSSQARRTWRAERPRSLGQSPIAPYTLVARTTFSRRPPPCASQRPMIRSVQPSPFFQPYTFAVSKTLIPRSSAASMTAKLSASLVTGPKFIVPRQRRLTTRPVRPRVAYCMPARLPDELVDVRRAEPVRRVVPPAEVHPRMDVVVPDRLPVLVDVDHRPVHLEEREHLGDVRIDDERVGLPGRLVHEAPLGGDPGVLEVPPRALDDVAVDRGRVAVARQEPRAPDPEQVAPEALGDVEVERAEPDVRLERDPDPLVVRDRRDDEVRPHVGRLGKLVGARDRRG